jgi:prevent-host-death family protein
MSRSELKKFTKTTRIKKRQSHDLLVNRRISVSEAKAHLSAVLKQVKSGKSVIVTDHGRDIAHIKAVQEPNLLKMVLPQRPFSEVKDTRATVPANSGTNPSIIPSILELLRTDRDSR